MPPRFVAVCALVLALLLLLLLPPRAGAGTHDVYSCQIPGFESVSAARDAVLGSTACSAPVTVRARP